MKLYILILLFAFFFFSKASAQVCVGYNTDLIDKQMRKNGYTFMMQKENLLYYSNEADSMFSVHHLDQYGICFKSVMIFPSNRTLWSNYKVLNSKGKLTDVLTWKIDMKGEEGILYAIITRYSKNYTITFVGK